MLPARARHVDVRKKLNQGVAHRLDFFFLNNATVVVVCELLDA
jgi:hypothetical protein